MPNLSFISPKAIIKESPIHGKGLFAVESIAQDEIVCIKGVSIINRKTLESMPGWFRAAEIQIADDFFIAPVKEEERDGSMIFSNHSCEPNIGVQGQIVFVAMRDIAPGEELTHDWAMTDDDENEHQCNLRRSDLPETHQRTRLEKRGFAGEVQGLHVVVLGRKGEGSTLITSSID